MVVESTATALLAAAGPGALALLLRLRNGRRRTAPQRALVELGEREHASLQLDIIDFEWSALLVVQLHHPAPGFTEFDDFDVHDSVGGVDDARFTVHAQAGERTFAFGRRRGGLGSPAGAPNAMTLAHGAVHSQRCAVGYGLGGWVTSEPSRRSLLNQPL